MSKPNPNLKSGNFFSLVVLLLGAFIVLLPVFVVFFTSFARLAASPENLSKNNWSLANYRVAWQQGNIFAGVC